ncbi:hypothetical protein [Mycolicibacterium wolinskyi]|uniref:hypothetical protein n=1 Tax=Mycolicibacterium wolinskyi TaxID=59750 RepID=UPI003917ADF6
MALTAVTPVVTAQLQETTSNRAIVADMPLAMASSKYEEAVVSSRPRLGHLYLYEFRDLIGEEHGVVWPERIHSRASLISWVSGSDDPGMAGRRNFDEDFNRSGWMAVDGLANSRDRMRARRSQVKSDASVAGAVVSDDVTRGIGMTNSSPWQTLSLLDWLPDRRS